MEILVEKSDANYDEIRVLIKVEDDLSDTKVLNELADVFVELSETIDEKIEECQLELDSRDTLNYCICVDNGTEKLYEEGIFSLFVQSGDEEIIAKGAKFVKNIVEWMKCEKVYAMWADEEYPFALVGASKLAIHDIKYIPVFIELMEVCDNEHEVYLADYIDEIVSTHGYIAETINLLAHRLAPKGGGQHGFEQISDNEEELMETFREKPELKELFFSTVRELTDDEMYLEEASQYLEDDDEREEWLEKALS